MGEVHSARYTPAGLCAITNSTGDDEYVVILIDTDNDGTPESFASDFCDYNQAATPAGCSVTQNITVPTVTEDTTFRGRVMLSYGTPAPANGCGANSYGDNEDFLIIADVQETITISDVSQDEDGGPITVSASLSHDVRDAGGFVSFSVDYQFSDGTATIADNDYVAASGTLTFNGQAGDTQVFTLAAVDALVQDNVPAGLTAITPLLIPAGTSFVVSGGTIDWTGIDIPASGSVTATYTAQVLPP